MSEPVAWHYPGGEPDQCTTDKAYAEKDPAWTPMYYKREWRDLTGAEVKTIRGDAKSMDDAIYMAETKLKEKNT